MKKIIYTYITAFFFIGLQANEYDTSLPGTADKADNIINESIDMPADFIQVHPQPFRVGEVSVSIDVPERILSTSIYTITGERMVFQVHNTMQTATKDIPYGLPEGEYLLKVESENSVGLRRIRVK